jgi:tRNA(Ile2)-agmatinylcytidine synthase
VKKYKYENPFCNECNARLKSAGKNKGFKCPKCSTIYREKKQAKKEVERTIQVEEYLPPIIAHRHLTKPKARQNRTNKGKIIKANEARKILRTLVQFGKK